MVNLSMNNFYSRFGDICEDQRNHIRLMRPTRHAIKRDLVKAQRDIIRRDRDAKAEAEAEAERQRSIEEEKAKKDLAKAYLKAMIEEEVAKSDEGGFWNPILNETSDCEGIRDVTLRINIKVGGETEFLFNVMIYPTGAHFSAHYWKSGCIDSFIDHVMDFRDKYAFDKYDSRFRLKTEVRNAGKMAFDEIFLKAVGDCCVCYDRTKSKTKCCKQYYCLVCESKVGSMCPMCRKSDPFSTSRSLDEDNEDDDDY